MTRNERRTTTTTTTRERKGKSSSFSHLSWRRTKAPSCRAREQYMQQCAAATCSISCGNVQRQHAAYYTAMCSSNMRQSRRGSINRYIQRPTPDYALEVARTKVTREGVLLATKLALLQGRKTTMAAESRNEEYSVCFLATTTWADIRMCRERRERR